MPAYSWTSFASATASVLRILMQACDAAVPIDAGWGVPCTYSVLPNGIFTLPMGLRGPGGVMVSFSAHGLSGGRHQGFQWTSVISKFPVGVGYRRIPTATRNERRIPVSPRTSSRYAGTLISMLMPACGAATDCPPIPTGSSSANRPKNRPTSLGLHHETVLIMTANAIPHDVGQTAQHKLPALPLCDVTGARVEAGVCSHAKLHEIGAQLCCHVMP